MGKQSVTLLKFLFHTIVVAHHLIVFYCLKHLDYSKSSDHYINTTKKFAFRFFTLWNFSLQCYYFILCMVDDLLQLTSSGIPSNLQTKMKKTKHFTFRTFVFPLSLTVAFVFWVLFHMDRKLIFPPEIDKVMPPWVNHALHTNIVVIAVMELATTFHWYPRARNHAITGITLYIVAYGICYLSTYLSHGIWLYPIYDVMNWTQRIILSIFVYVLTVGFYFFGEGVNTKIWENEVQNKSHRKVKVK